MFRAGLGGPWFSEDDTGAGRDGFTSPFGASEVTTTGDSVRRRLVDSADPNGTGSNGENACAADVGGGTGLGPTPPEMVSPAPLVPLSVRPVARLFCGGAMALCDR